MNKQAIESAKDPDLRLSMAAMQRAAQRAHDLARQTGTAIVISHQGVVQWIYQIRQPTDPTTSLPEGEGPALSLQTMSSLAPKV